MNFYSSNRRTRNVSPSYSLLEPRTLLAGISIETFAGRETLLIDGGSQDDVALVADSSADEVQVLLNGQTETFNKSDFERIRFLGRSGDDFFFNGTNIDSSAFGHGGNDELIGGSGHNWIQGGGGNDEITGGDKNDNLRGRAGNDVIDGGKRHDRIFGSEGNDLIVGGAGNDFIQGESGRDQIFGGNGDDLINGGVDDDTIDAGSGNDTVQFSRIYAAYTIIGDSMFSVTDNVGNEGTDQVSDAQTFRFADVNVPAEVAPTAAERVIIRPIVVSNSDGTNTAEFFGSDSQEADIKFMIDDIFAQANIDIFWEAEQSWNNSFANIGDSGGIRSGSDLSTIVTSGDNAGLGSSSEIVIDMYFVEVVPGSAATGNNVVNGVAFISSSGVAVHVGDNLVNFPSGRDIVAGVVAHEIAHNLGLQHVSESGNLLAENGDGTTLTSSQINQVIASPFSVPV